MSQIHRRNSTMSYNVKGLFFEFVWAKWPRPYENSVGTAGLAQLVERDVANVKVASSNLVPRSKYKAQPSCWAFSFFCFQILKADVEISVSSVSIRPEAITE